MSTYKLIYFNSRGRAETSRFIFAQAGVKYEDKRVEKEEWAQLKPSTPTGMLPLLEVDGKQISGSGVIARFLAERLGLAGSNDLENAGIASIVDVLNDLVPNFVAFYHEKNEDSKAEKLKKLKEEDMPKYWGIIEGFFNKSPGDWVYGDNPTYADFEIYNMLGITEMVVPDFVPSDFLKNYPGVTKMKAAVEALPNIAEWIKNRPVADN